MTAAPSNTLLVAIGSSHGDDQAAWKVADLLTSRRNDMLQIRTASVPAKVIDWLDGVDELHIVDACEGGGPPGELLHWEWESVDVEPFLMRQRTGTHDLDVLSVLELARSLGRIPRRTVIWGIIGTDFEPGNGLSGDVECRLASIADTITTEVTDARKVSGAFTPEAG